jgi:putative transcriptional regulator
MAKKAEFKSDAFAAIHASVAALQKVGAIDMTTKRQFDASCLATPNVLEPAQIKKSEVSQPDAHD